MRWYLCIVGYLFIFSTFLMFIVPHDTELSPRQIMKYGAQLFYKWRKGYLLIALLTTVVIAGFMYLSGDLNSLTPAAHAGVDVDADGNPIDDEPIVDAVDVANAQSNAAELAPSVPVPPTMIPTAAVQGSLDAVPYGASETDASDLNPSTTLSKLSDINPLSIMIAIGQTILSVLITTILGLSTVYYTKQLTTEDETSVWRALGDAIKNSIKLITSDIVQLFLALRLPLLVAITLLLLGVALYSSIDFLHMGIPKTSSDVFFQIISLLWFFIITIRFIKNSLSLLFTKYVAVFEGKFFRAGYLQSSSLVQGRRWSIFYRLVVIMCVYMIIVAALMTLLAMLQKALSSGMLYGSLDVLSSFKLLFDSFGIVVLSLCGSLITCVIAVRYLNLTHRQSSSLISTDLNSSSPSL